MTDRPITFSAPMIRALLSGSKTMTRRLPKAAFAAAMDAAGDALIKRYPHQHGSGYEVGDRLWVRENWHTHCKWDDKPPRDIPPDQPAWFPSDETERPWGILRPSIHMPRWASRLTLTVTGVKVERLQEISEEDARAEGVEGPEVEREDHDWSICPQCGGIGIYNGLGANLGVMPDCDCYECDTHRKRFTHLWNSLHGPDAWADNPWIVAVSFTVARHNIDKEGA